jgi:hypothetical protein
MKKNLTFRGEGLFLIPSLLLFLIFQWIIASGSIQSLFNRIFKTNLLASMGISTSVGFNKILVFNLLAFLFVGTTIALWAWNYFNKRKFSLLLLILFIGLYGASILTINYPVYNFRIQREDIPADQVEVDVTHMGINFLEIETLHFVDYEEIFSKNHLLTAEIESFDDFYQFARRRYGLSQSEIEQKWGLDEKLDQAYFYMNLVSAMWGYGNQDEPDKPGCVLSNEDNQWRSIPEEEITIRTYIESDIGCCEDFAYLLKYLLDREGIDNRLVSYYGHIFNEITVSDESYTLDANTNLVFHSAWAKIQENGKVIVTIFPLVNLIRQDNPYYRLELGRFQMSVLLLAAQRAEYPISYPELPPYIGD